MKKAQKWYVIVCVVYTTYILCTGVSGCLHVAKRNLNSAASSVQRATDRLVDATIPSEPPPRYSRTEGQRAR